MIPRLLITPGEPAGIGPDITAQIAQYPFAAELIFVADQNLMQARAKQLGLVLDLSPVDYQAAPQAGKIKIHHLPVNAAVKAGILDSANAAYVISTLAKAANICQQGQAQGIVTAPVNKAVINQAGISFSGHTEFFAEQCAVSQTVMLFVVKDMKVALLTTHVPLAQVPSLITKQKLHGVIAVLQQGLSKQFKIAKPKILVCGLNPHAGENGYLGREEIDVIQPALADLQKQGYDVQGPLSADTIFLQKADAILAMYHDQALPLVKYAGFGESVNVTLGLPFIRTSVDHGTALDLAGSGKADASSMKAAVDLAIKLSLKTL